MQIYHVSRNYSKSLEKQKKELSNQYLDFQYLYTDHPCGDPKIHFMASGKKIAVKSDRLVKGMTVSHFKRRPEDKGTSKYLYEILTLDAIDTETGERAVVYKALYTDENTEPEQIFVRPYDIFMSEVDTEKYPEATQKYRFEHHI